MRVQEFFRICPAEDKCFGKHAASKWLQFAGQLEYVV